MTKNEFQAVNALYIKLMEKGKENRTEQEELQYTYLDKLITYIRLRSTAIRMGNKNPDDNFMVKDAKSRMEEAQRNMNNAMNA